MVSNRVVRAINVLAVVSLALAFQAAQAQDGGTPDGGDDLSLGFHTFQAYGDPDLYTDDYPPDPLPDYETETIGFVFDGTVCGPSGGTTVTAEAVDDLPSDITDIIFGSCFASAVTEYNCGAPNVPNTYIPGIQADDDPLVDDAATANAYLDYASRGANNRASAIRHWSLLFYYNEPSLNPRVPRDGSGSVQVLVNGAHSTLRNATRGGGGAITQWGDQDEVRMLGLWASMGPDNFRTHTWPGGDFGGRDAATRARNQADFQKFLDDKASNRDWQSFIVRASLQVARSFHCGKTIFAHSGGGATLAFIMQLLAVKFSSDLPGWFRGGGRVPIVGLEMVYSDSLALFWLYDDFSPYFGQISMQNVIVGPNGSGTWQNPIVVELTRVNETPYVTDHTNINDIGLRPGFQAGFLAHPAVGMVVLQNGRIRNITFGAP